MSYFDGTYELLKLSSQSVVLFCVGVKVYFVTWRFLRVELRVIVLIFPYNGLTITYLLLSFDFHLDPSANTSILT